MAGSCCAGTPGPPGAQGPPGTPGGPPGPPGPPGQDGVTPQFADTACVEFGGDGTAGAPITASPVVNPNACNALSCTGAGLLVPEVALQPLASSAPGPVAGSRSVDVRVTHAGGCPDRWQIGAQLSPAVGTGRLGAARVLHNNPNGWLNTALTARLPEPGRYMVSWDVNAQICATARYCTNMWVDARVVDNATAAQLAAPRTITQHQVAIPNNGERLQACHTGTAPITHLVGVTAAQGARVLRLQGAFHNTTTCAGSSVQSASIGIRTYVTWHKITD